MPPPITFINSEFETILALPSTKGVVEFWTTLSSPIILPLVTTDTVLYLPDVKVFVEPLISWDSPNTPSLLVFVIVLLWPLTKLCKVLPLTLLDSPITKVILLLVNVLFLPDTNESSLFVIVFPVPNAVFILASVIAFVFPDTILPSPLLI